MFWSVDNDDFRGICHGKPFPLIEAAKLAYLTGEASSTNRTTNKRPSLNRFSSSNNRRVTTPTPPKTTTGAPTTTTNKRRNKNRRNKNKKKKKVTSSTTTTPAPTSSNPLSTPEPPTTPDPGVDFECKDDGFFPHPRECKKYFWCLDAPGLGLVAHHFTCPAGLYFNKNTDSCDYARNVACKDKSAAAAVAAKTTTTIATTTTTTQAPKTTTTTTTEAPEDEEEYEDEEEEEEEEDEPEVVLIKLDD
jgi:chitinase